jgi:hypothetical protein
MHLLARALRFGSALALLAGAVTLTAQTPDRAIGIWTLNVAKSKYDPGPPPKSMTVTYEAVGQGLKVSVKGTEADGRPIVMSYIANYDGKDYPVTIAGATAYDTVTLKQIDASTVEATRKKGGQVVLTFARVVSADGRMLTMTVNGTDNEGQRFNDVAVFERQ